MKRDSARRSNSSQSKLSIFKPSFAATMQEDVPEQNKKYEVCYF